MKEPRTAAGKALLEAILRDLYPPDAWADGKGDRAATYGAAIARVEDEAAALGGETAGHERSSNTR